MRTVKRLLTLAVAVSGLLVSSASLAAAEPYQIPPPTLTVDRGTIIEGQSVTVTGTNFGNNETVDWSANTQGTAAGRIGRSVPLRAADNQSGVLQADGDGHFQASITFTEKGRYLIVAIGRATGRTGSVSVRVLPEGSELPNTGNNGSYLGIVLIGSAVVVAGIALLVFTRMRRRTRLDA